MSCKHGNWAPCELCEETLQAWKDGYAAAKQEDEEEIADFKKAYELLFKENHNLRKNHE